MKSALTVQEVLSRLEMQAASLQKKTAFHREQEEHHRELRQRFAAEAEAAVQRLEQFRGAASVAVEHAAGATPPPEPLGPRPGTQRLIEAAIQAFGPAEPFGATKVLQEIERRHGPTLKRLPDPEHVSIALRRMGRNRRLHQIRRGKPHWEALYVREKPASETPEKGE
jgi:hypothetical protein